MKSPFPGMDPYIEACGLWGDFHYRLIALIADSLSQAAPDHYLVRTQERSYLVLVEPEGKEAHPFYPDVTVTTPETRKKPRRTRGDTALAEPAGGVEPFAVRALVTEEHREAFVEIYEAGPEQRLVTCIEVLSPSNKRPGSEGRVEYLRKRQSVLLGGVNLVEIDLLRGGERMPMFDPWPDCLYTLTVGRAHRFHRCLVWPGHFRQPLPKVPVPLAPPDPDLTLDLQPLVDTVYERSRYARSIDYRKPLTPPLAADDATWLEQQLQGRRTRAR